MSETIVLTCKICGWDFPLRDGELIACCPGCGTAQSRPRVSQDALLDLHRAHKQRCACDFTNAADSYQHVLRVHPDSAEALWGLALCKYGVEYVQDEKSGERLPVVHFLNRRPITEDPDYLLAYAHAAPEDRPGYQRDAAYISRIQQDVLAAEGRGDAWDVFLCYKSSVPGAPDDHTREFVHAQELYIALRDAGYSVFFAHTTLRRAAGANYEAQVFHALQSARAMLVVVSDPAHLNTPWVHSEWSRYLERVDAREDCRLIPLLYDGCDPYALPDAFLRRSIQGLRMDSLTALDDLRGVLESCVAPKQTAQPEAPVAPQPVSPATEPLLRRAFLFLEDGDWQSADAYCEKVLDADPECARAYVGKLMAALHVTQQKKLRDLAQPFDGDLNYKRALRFADAALKKELQDANHLATQRHDLAQKESAYIKAAEAMTYARTEDAYKTASKLFIAVSGYKDATDLADQCLEKAEAARKDSLYEAASANHRSARNIVGYETAMYAFKKIAGWRDADERIKQCQESIDEIRAQERAEEEKKRREHEAVISAKQRAKRKKANRAIIQMLLALFLVAAGLLTVFVIMPNNKYNEAVSLMETGQYEAAIAIFEEIPSSKDSQALIGICNTAIMDGKYNAAVALMENGDYHAAVAAFEALNGYRDSRAQMVNCNTVIMDGKYNAALALMESGDYHAAIAAFEALNGYKDSQSQIGNCEIAILDSKYDAAVALKNAGKYRKAIQAFAELDGYRGSLEQIENCFSAFLDENTVHNVIAAGWSHTVGLRANGTVVAVGANKYGQCNTSSWSDIVAVDAGEDHTVGLRANGTVVAVGRNGDGRCNTSAWSDIVAIAAGNYHTVGLRADGTVVAVGLNDNGQCNTSGWTDIVAIAAGIYHTVGLRIDGTVVAVGLNSWGECDVSAWSDIVVIAADDQSSVGLRADGTVVVAGGRSSSQRRTSAWTDIVAITSGQTYTVGLRADGTVVVAGNSSNSACDTIGWSDIVAIAAYGRHTVGLRSNGTAVAVGYNGSGECNVSSWQLKTIPRPTLPK